MNRIFVVFNFIGVLTLAILCTLQWQANSGLNDRADRLEATRAQQARKLAEDDQTLNGQAADLQEFRQRLVFAESELKASESKLEHMTIERNQLDDQLDQYKAALSKWRVAVTERDAVLSKAAAEIQSLVKERNDVVAKINDLAVKYNQLVKASG
jgi:chromosome segregation ATPase